MAETNLIAAIEKLLNKKFSDKKVSATDIIKKYENLTGNKFELDDVKEEILDFVIYAKEKIIEFTDKTVYSAEKLEDSFKKISNVNLDKSLQMTSNSSIELLRTSFSKINNIVVSSTKSMFTYGTNIIKGFFSDISKKTDSMLSNIFTPLKNMLATVLVPFKMIGTFFSGMKTLFSTGIKGLFGGDLFTSEKDEKDNDRAGITKKVLGENLILKRTSVGIAIAWLWKQMNKNGSGGLGGANSSDGILETAKDIALLTSAGGIKGFLKKIGLFTFKAAGAAGLAYSLFNVGSNVYDYFNETNPEKKQTAGEKTLGSGAVTAASMSLALIPGVGLPAAMIVSGIANALMTPEMEEKIGESILYVYNGAIDLAKRAWEAIPTWEEFKTSIYEGYDKYIGKPLGDLGTNISNWLSGIRNKISTWWDGAVKWWDSLWEEFKTSIYEGYDKYIGKPLGDLGTNISNWLSGIRNKISTWWDGAVKWWDSLWEDSKTIEQKKNDHLEDLETAFDPYNLSKNNQKISEEIALKEKNALELGNAVLKKELEITKQTASNMEEKNQIDKNINESVVKFSETAENLNKPLKDFTEEIKRNTELSATSSFFNNVSKALSGSGGRVGSSGSGGTYTGSYSTPLISATGSIMFTQGRLKGKKFDNFEDALATLISRSEGGFSSVNRNDSDSGVSLGFGQWNSERARDLLLRMQKQDPNSFNSMMGERLVKALEDPSRWATGKGTHKYAFSIDEQRAFAKLASRGDMQQVQVEKMRQDMKTYFAETDKLKITDMRAKMFFADLRHQYGLGGAKKLIGDSRTLEDMYERVKNTQYSKRRGEVYRDLLSLQELEKKTKEVEVKAHKVEPVNIQNKEAEERGKTYKTLAEAVSKLQISFDKSAKKDDANITKIQTTDNSTVISNSSQDDSDRIPNQIMSYVFGVNAGGNDTLNILGSE